MAKQTVNIGAAANDGTGDPLRTAFDKINDNTDELYAKPDLTLAANILTLTKADGTTDTVDLSTYLDEDARAIASGTIDGAGIVTFTRDDASTFTLDLSSLLDDTNIITSVNTQTGAVVLDTDNISEGSTNLYNQTHTGDVTGSTALTIAVDAVDGSNIADDSIDSEHYVDGSIDTAHLANDSVTHDKLEARFTAKQDIATTSGTINLDASSYGIFELTSDLTGATTLNIQNIKKGQVIDILVSGSQTITLADDFTTSAINQAGSGAYDGASDNHIQVVCIDDNDSDAILIYSVATYTSDTDPS